jgi:DeoR/GlpR family transcriptional regulator of sugar metabolism
VDVSKELFPEERQQEILRLISQEGRVAVGELSRRYSVSEVTIRADLQNLAAQGLIIRTHGGAMLMPQAPELSLTLRRQQQVAEKERIGAAAASYVSNGDAIFLDTSSTTLALARNLIHHRELTILTNSLAVAQTVMNVTGVTVVMTGGVLRRDTVSLIGTQGLDLLHNYNISTGFFGAHGLSFPEGLTDVSVGEAEVKREVVAKCRQVIAVLDATKWGRVGPASFARPEDINIIITDQQAPARLVAQACTLGVQVQQV